VDDWDRYLVQLAELGDIRLDDPTRIAEALINEKYLDYNRKFERLPPRTAVRVSLRDKEHTSEWEGCDCMTPTCVSTIQYWAIPRW
jgi:hypothetical protein